MTVLYVARKKVFKVAGMVKSLYYAIPKALQKQGVKSRQMAQDMAYTSSLTPGDVASVLTQLPTHIVKYLKDGRTVTIDGLGTFYLGISSSGAETPEECKPSTITSYRICFRPDPKMKDQLIGCDFKRIPEMNENDKAE